MPQRVFEHWVLSGGFFFLASRPGARFWPQHYVYSSLRSLQRRPLLASRHTDRFCDGLWDTADPESLTLPVHGSCSHMLPQHSRIPEEEIPYMRATNPPKTLPVSQPGQTFCGRVSSFLVNPHRSLNTEAHREKKSTQASLACFHRIPKKMRAYSPLSSISG